MKFDNITDLLYLYPNKNKQNNDKIMNQTTPELLFNSVLNINYDERFIPIAQAFVERLTELAGGNEKEIYQLSLVLEESLIFIINKYFDNNCKQHTEISYNLLLNNLIEIELTNIGPPIQIDKIPKFDIEDENTDDGLWFQMAKQLVNKFEFINKLNKGWVIKISKEIPFVSFMEKSTIKNDEKNAEILGEIITRPAVPEDAAALVDLAYMTYRYSYCLPSYYDSNNLKNLIENHKFDIIVAEMNNKIIGSLSVKYYGHNSVFGELGSAMVNPSYRRTPTLLLLIRAISIYHKDNPQNKDFFASYLTTTHIISQRGTAKVNYGYKPLLFLLNIWKRPSYVGIDETNDSPESGLVVYYFHKKLTANKIFVNNKDSDLIKELISNTNNEIEISSETKIPEAENSEIFLKKIESIGSNILSVDDFGINWDLDIRKELLNLTTSNVKTVIVNVSTAKPLPFNFEEKLTNLNLIFSGLFINSLDDIRLCYILTTEKVDFDIIKLDSLISQKLLAHIKEQYKRL